MSHPAMQLTESMMQQSETFVCLNAAHAGPGSLANAPGFVSGHRSPYEMFFFDVNTDTVSTARSSTAMLPELVEFCNERKAEKLDAQMIAAILTAW